MSTDATQERRLTTRRTLVKGAAWSVPVVVATSQVAHAGPSQCEVDSSITLGPTTPNVNIRAVCREDSQDPFNPRVIIQEYGVGSLPTYLQICNCQQEPAYYRWRETDSRSNFQIEVDGEHNDQNAGGGGYRTPFFLDSFGGEGGCRTFNLTYRASDNLPTSAVGLTIEWTLQRRVGTSGPWSTIQVFTYTGGSVRRRAGVSNPDWTCDSGRSGQRAAGEVAGTSSSGDDDAATTAAPRDTSVTSSPEEPMSDGD